MQAASHYLQPRGLRHLVLLAALFLAAFGWASVAAAQDYPPVPDGPVFDGADMLSSTTEAQLDQRLRDYNRETGRSLIIATVPSLEGETIERYATGLFSEWGIGGAERDMGLLLLVSRDDRELRIEIGYGLHAYFGGIMANRVIEDTITPRFKQGDFDGGVTSGIDDIIEHLANSPEDAIAIEEAAQAAQEQRSRSDGGFPIGAIIWLGFFFFFFVMPILGARGRRRKYRKRRKGPWGKRDDEDDDDWDDDDDDGWGRTARDIILWEVGSAIARGAMSGGGSSGGGSWGGGGGFGGFGGGMSGGGGASGSW